MQVVRHHGGDWAYGITADPFWDTAWKVVKCGAAIAGFIAGNALLVLEVRKAGGVVEVAKVLVGGGSVEQMLKAAVAIFGTVAGITGVVSACK